MEALPIVVDVEPDGAFDARALPARPGVFAIEDDAQRTIALAVTSSLRRQVRRRLDASDMRPRRVRAATAESGFEADWIYLGEARRRLPHLLGALRDRWQAWFVHCDPRAAFPQLLRTDRPPAVGRAIGPLPDRHAARRAIEILEDAFDLCRYPNILLEAPEGVACAYKEMGRCAAPCDGSVPMSAYQSTIAEAADFLAGPPNLARATLEASMHEAARAQDYEGAAHRRRRLEATAALSGPAFRVLRDLDRLRFLAIAPGAPGRARVFIVHAGFIMPIVDVVPDPDDATLAVLREHAHGVRGRDAVRDDAWWDTLGLVGWHLHRRTGAPRDVEFIAIPEDLEAPRLRASIARACRSPKDETPASDRADHQHQEPTGT